MSGGVLEGDGKTEVLVTNDHSRGLVILRFPKPIEWVGLDPQNAMMIAGAMVKEAYEMRFKKPANDIKISRLFGDVEREITQAKRDVLVNRVVLIMNTGVTQHRSPKWTAEAIVDRILTDTK